MSNINVHLAWIRQTGYRSTHTPQEYRSYYDYMQHIYNAMVAQRNLSQDDIEFFASQCLATDSRTHHHTQERLKMITRELNKSNKCVNSHFVTIGFCIDNFEVQGVYKMLQSMSKYEWIEKAEAVMEYYTNNSKIHPHAHMKISTYENWTPSKLAEKIFAVAKMKKFVYKKNFIDIKPYLEIEHNKYIVGEKTEEKLKNVEMDKQWRLENNIPDKIIIK